MNGPTFEGQDDYIPDSTLEILQERWDALPDEFEWVLSSADASGFSVRVLVPEVDTVDTIHASEVMRCAVVALGALLRNLRWEREQRALRDAQG